MEEDGERTRKIEYLCRIFQEAASKIPPDAAAVEKALSEVQPDTLLLAQVRTRIGGSSQPHSSDGQHLSDLLDPHIRVSELRAQLAASEELRTSIDAMNIASTKLQNASLKLGGVVLFFAVVQTIVAVLTLKGCDKDRPPQVTQPATIAAPAAPFSVGVPAPAQTIGLPPH
jgi:hypothetical protein